MGTHLSIDETCLSTGEVYTILSNKEAHGRKSIKKWYAKVGEKNIRDNMKNVIGEKRRKEIKVPDACAGFYDEKRKNDVRKNNL